jgi:hypothetical protein
MKSRFVSYIVLVVACLILIAPTLSQDLSDIPQVTISVSDGEVTVSPGEIPSGITTLVFENPNAEAYDSLVARFREGFTPEDLIEASSTGDPFAPLQLLHLYGGTLALPETDTAITLDLKSGMHILLMRPFGPIFFNVVESEGEVEAPEADVTLAFVDFAFGFPSKIDTGELVWHVQNVGEQWHEAVLIRVDEGTSLEEASALVATTLSPTGEPVADSPADLVYIWPPMDPGENAWITMDLESGTYVIGCLLLDLSLMPEMHQHLEHGMIRMFTVE